MNKPRSRRQNLLKLLNKTEAYREHLADLAYPKHWGYVYVMQSSSGHYKIGKTAYLFDRIADISHDLAFEVQYCAIIESTYYSQLELQLHRHFANKRVGREWFRLDTADLEYIHNVQMEQREKILGVRYVREKVFNQKVYEFWDEYPD